MTTTSTTTRTLPPGDTGLPLLGETLPFIQNSFAFIEERFRKHGPVFKTNILGGPLACFVGPQALSIFLDPKYFTREDASPPGVRNLLSTDAVPFIDGERHRIRKGILLKAVGPTTLGTYFPTLQRACASRVDRWAVAGSISLADEAAELAFAITEALFAGGDVNKPDADLRKSFDAFSAGVFALPVNLPFATYGKAMQAREYLRGRFAERVKAQKAQPGPTVMSALITADVDGHRLTDDEVVTETLHFFFAAYSGMCGFLTNLGLGISAHPEVQKKLRDELDSQRGTPLSLESLRAFPYLELVCKEAKRFYPVVPITFFAKARVNVPVGEFVVPAGWRALGCTFSTLQDEKSFAEPRKFDPERFAAGREEDRKHEHAFVPQGGGPLTGHRCAGEAFSTVLMKLMAISLLSRCELELPPQNTSFAMAVIPPTPRDRVRLTLRQRA